MSGADSGVVDVWRKKEMRGNGVEDAANTQATNSARRLASTEDYERLGEP